MSEVADRMTSSPQYKEKIARWEAFWSLEDIGRPLWILPRAPILLSRQSEPSPLLYQDKERQFNAEISLTDCSQKIEWGGYGSSGGQHMLDGVDPGVALGQGRGPVGFGDVFNPGLNLRSAFQVHPPEPDACIRRGRQKRHRHPVAAVQADARETRRTTQCLLL